MSVGYRTALSLQHKLPESTMSSPAVKSQPIFLAYAVIDAPSSGHDERLKKRGEDPFTLLRRIDESIGSGDALVLEVHGYLNTLAISHIQAMWRATISRGASFRCVLFNAFSFEVVKRTGLQRIIDFRMCPNSDSTEECGRCTSGCEVGYDAL